MPLLLFIFRLVMITYLAVACRYAWLVDRVKCDDVNDF